MKKRVASLLTAFLLTLTLFPAVALAAGSAFRDITDSATATAAESLRLMGVLDGYGDGTFRPEGTLNRAQFCKMVINTIGAEKQLGRYASVTVFPDVKPSYWAAPYINLAAKGEKIVAGYADGSFHPERSVTLGHAVTILLRLLGYKDADIGGIWPNSYVAVAASTGLLDGVGTVGSAALTRGQAARLFVNLLRAETADGAAYFTLSEETTLNSLDAGGKLVTPERTYDMEYPQSSTTLTGSRGQVVLRGGKALTFLPVDMASPSSSAGVIIVGSNGSTTGFAALTGNRTEYAIYKNGVLSSAGALRAGDTAVYSPSANAVQVCDTRITAYYENCSPSPESPATVEILGGTEFTVLPAAVDSLSQFRPGKVVTFLLTADGRIAGASDSTRSAYQGNAVAVQTGGGAKLICGGTEIALNCSIPETYGRAAKIGSDKDGNLTFTSLGKAASGTLDAAARKLGSRKLAANVRVYDADGILAQEDWGDVSAADITASRLNWAGDVDLVMVGGAQSSLFYGIAKVETTYGEERPVNDAEGRSPGDEEWEETYSSEVVVELTVECNGKTVGPFPNTVGLKNGDMVAVKIDKAGTRFTSGVSLRKFSNVSSASWVGKTAVTYGGRTYSVSKDIPCYNRDNGRWMDLDAALKYGDTFQLYLYDNTVRIVEVGG